MLVEAGKPAVKIYSFDNGLIDVPQLKEPFPIKIEEVRPLNTEFKQGMLVTVIGTGFSNDTVITLSSTVTSSQNSVDKTSFEIDRITFMMPTISGFSTQVSGSTPLQAKLSVSFTTIGIILKDERLIPIGAANVPAVSAVSPTVLFPGRKALI